MSARANLYRMPSASAGESHPILTIPRSHTIFDSTVLDLIEVARGGCPPRALTDPDVQVSRIRFLGPQIRYVRRTEWTHRAGGSGYVWRRHVNLRHGIVLC